MHQKIGRLPTKPVNPYQHVIRKDPLQLGVVASLARPGGNITGVTLYGTELSGTALPGGRVRRVKL